MLLSPLLFLIYWLLLGLVVVTAITYREPAWRWPAAAIGVGSSLFIWLWQRLSLPLVATLPRWADMLPIPRWEWVMDGISWELSGLLLLMVTAVCLALWQQADDTPGLPSFLLLLTLTGLATLWAGTMPTLLAGWMLFTGVWFTLLSMSSGDGLRQLRWHLLTFFCLWLVGILISRNGSGGLRTNNPDSVISTLLLLAALLQMGIWPLHGWRPAAARLSLPLAWLLHTAPPLTGAATLVRLVQINGTMLDSTLAFTAIGLFGFLVGVAFCWRHLAEPARAVRWAAMALAGLTYLAGLWGGVTALLAATTTLVLATGILFLLAERPLQRPRPLWRYGWRLAAPLLALATIAGLPLMPGFATHLALYNGWVNTGGGVLLMVAALLHLLLITAVYQLVRGVAAPLPEPPAEADEAATTDEAETVDTPAWSPLATPDWVDRAVLLLGVGLLANGRWLTVTEVDRFHWLAVVVLAMTVGLAALLSRYLKQEQSVWFNWRELLPASARRDKLVRLALDWLRGSVQLLRDAALILEGESGLLWLLALLLLFWLL